MQLKKKKELHSLFFSQLLQLSWGPIPATRPELDPKTETWV